TTKLDTSTTPTVFTDTTTTTAVCASNKYSRIATGTPEIAASSGSKIEYASLDHSTSVTTSAITATPTTTCSTCGVTASMFPNSRLSTSTWRSLAVRRPRNSTPSAKLNEKNTPVATSPRSDVRRSTKPMPSAIVAVNGIAIHTACSTEAPRNRPIAMPPNAACARPSPRNASPRWTTNTPITAHTAA